MDSNDVEIVIKSGSVNGRQAEDEIDAFASYVVKIAHEMLSHSHITIDVHKHRNVTKFNRRG